MESDEEVQVMYAVEGIHNKRFDRNGKPEYYVKWKGFKQKTWEPIDHLLNLPELIYEYDQAHKQRKRPLEANVKKIAKDPKETAPRKKKLTKLSRKECEPSNMVDLDSSIEGINPSYMAPRDAECEENKEEISELSRDRPRVKFTRDFAQEPTGWSKEPGSGREKMNVYVDEVERVTGVERRNEKWMARV